MELGRARMSQPTLPAIVLDILADLAAIYCTGTGNALEETTIAKLKLLWGAWYKTLLSEGIHHAVPKTRAAVAKCLVDFLTADPEGDWWVLPAKDDEDDDDDDEDSIGGMLRLLEDKDHIVATTAANYTAVLIRLLNDDSKKEFVEAMKSICIHFIDEWSTLVEITVQEDDDPVSQGFICLAQKEQLAVRAMLVLSEAAKVYPPAQRMAVMLLSRHASPKCAISPVVSKIIGQIAASIGRCTTDDAHSIKTPTADGITTKDYFSGQVLSQVVADWLEQCSVDELAQGNIYKTSFFKFPAHLLTTVEATQASHGVLLYPQRALPNDQLKRNFNEFVSGNMETILPTTIRIFISRSTTLATIDAWLERFAEIASCEVAELIAEHFPRIIGWTLFHAVDQETRPLYQDFLTKHVPKFENSSFSKLELSNILVELITYADTAPDSFISLSDDAMSQSQGHASGSAIDTKTLFDVLEFVKDNFDGVLKKYRSVGDFLLVKHGAQGILLRLSMSLAHARQGCDQHAVFRVFKLVVEDSGILHLPDRLGSSINFAKSYYLQDVVNVLVRTISKIPELLEKACGVLLAMCTSAMQHMPDKLAPLVHNIISALLKHAPTSDVDDGPIAGQWYASCAMEIIELLVNSDESVIKDEVKSLTPFPKTGVFNKVRAQHVAIRGSTTLADDLNHFLQIAKQQESTSRVLELTYLRDKLRDSKEDLKLGVVSTNIPKILAVLLDLCASSNQQCRELIASCLGELGAFNLDTVALPRVATTASTAAERKSSRAVPAMQFLIQAAEPYLADTDADVVEAAAVSLNMLHSIESPSTQRSKSSTLDDSPLCQELPWLRQTHALISAEATERHRNIETAGLFNWDQVWNPATAASYAEWIQRITYKLISFGADGSSDVSAFSALQPLCHRRNEFCKLLLPHIVLAILKHDPGGQKKGSLSAIFVTFFEEAACMDKSDAVHKECALAMINAINVLRQCPMEASVSRHSGDAHAKKRSRTSGASEPTHWDNLSWLDVNFLEIAKTASVCSADFTTMYYAEIWCEKKGVADLQDADLQDTENSECRNVLVEASRGIGEPDTIHGILHAALETDSLVHLYEHGGEWGHALGIHDSKSRLCAQNAAGSFHGAGDTPVSDSSIKSTASLGIVRALHAMGYNHLLGVFSSSIGKEMKQLEKAGFKPASHVRAELQQHQFEAAWRGSLWNSKGIEPVPETTLLSSPTFPQYLCRLLTVFSQELPLIGTGRGDPTSLHTLVQRARSDAMSDMLAFASESSSNLYPMLVRFQSLVEIEEIFCGLGDRTSGAPALSLDDLQQRWSLRLDTTAVNWDSRDPIIALRACLLNIARIRVGGPNTHNAEQNAEQIRDMLSTTLKDHASLGRTVGRFQSALTTSSLMEHLSADGKQEERGGTVKQWAIRTEYHASLVKCECYWERGEQTLAKRMLLGLITRLDKSR